MGGFSAGLGLGASISDAIRKKVELRRVSKANARSRGVGDVGKVLFGDLATLGNDISVFCREQDTSNRLIVERVRATLALGLTSVVVHAGNVNLVNEIASSGAACRMIVLDASNQRYDPLCGLSPTEAGKVVSDAMSIACAEGDDEAGSVVEAEASVLKAKGLDPYVRAIEACPVAHLNAIITKLEVRGSIIPSDAASLRGAVIASTGGQSHVRTFLARAVACGPFSWDGIKALSVCSVAGTGASAVLCIDVGRGATAETLTLVMADIMRANRAGLPIHSAFNLNAYPHGFSGTLRSGGLGGCWTVAAGDCSTAFAEDAGEIIDVSDAALIFSQGYAGASVVSAYLGDYDKVEVQRNVSGGSSLGSFGYHFSDNKGLSFSPSRERVVKEEEIRSLPSRSFLLLGGYGGGVLMGKAV